MSMDGTPTDTTRRAFHWPRAGMAGFNLSPREAAIATAWVEQKIDRRSMLTNKDRVEDVRDAMWQLEKDGEIVVHRITDAHADHRQDALRLGKKIPTNRLWHHKSCGQCGNIRAIPFHCSGSRTSSVFLISTKRIRPLHSLELSRVGHRQYREPGRGVPPQFPPGLCFR